jgi:hypothetical protein
LSNQVPTIGLGNAQQFENYKNIYPRYTSIQGSVVQTLQVRAKVCLRELQ